MRSPQNQPDELARRRAQKHLEARDRERAHEDPVEAEPRFEWTDILAMIIAAYQIILPIVLMFIGVVVLIYFAFKLAFVR